jgi:hypothetical protein
MEPETVEGISAEIETLKANVAMYRRLAAQRRAADYLPIADKLMEAAAKAEAKVLVKAAELERMLAEPRTQSGRPSQQRAGLSHASMSTMLPGA